jgi:hypothetical protein
VTVTTAMNPVDMLNPSDDYIWQILFAGENDAVPKRVTGEPGAHHAHQPGCLFCDATAPHPLALPPWRRTFVPANGLAAS